jgi:predicted DNA-binding transcriptional regulator YafY
MSNAQFTLATKLSQLRTAEALLLRGATVPQLMEACGVSDRQIRRYFDQFRELGTPVSSDAEPGQREFAVFRIAKGDAIFRHRKGELVDG